MKKCLLIVLLMVLLTGCSAQETFETLSDSYDTAVIAPMAQLDLELPKEAAEASMGSDHTGKLYLCDGYSLTVQTLEAGDLNETLEQLTGYREEQLTVMATQRDGVDRYETVWTAAGEGGDQIGRAVILSDGQYHYAVTVMANAQAVGALTPVWQSLLASAELSHTE